MIHLLHSSKHLLAAWVFLIVAITATAADKSGVSPNTISLPKGPGSIEGLGESFQPTLNTGTAKYSLKLALPPGTAGHAPEIVLAYDGGSGNGVLGFGWSIPLASIQRRSDKGIPLYGQTNLLSRADVFLNELKEELVPVEAGYWFSKNEGAFIRYQQVGEHWKANLPDGVTQILGGSESSRVSDASTAP